MFRFRKRPENEPLTHIGTGVNMEHPTKIVPLSIPDSYRKRHMFVFGTHVKLSWLETKDILDLEDILLHFPTPVGAGAGTGEVCVPPTPPDLIVSLGHDIGKIPSYHDKLYSTGDHPLISVIILNRITEYASLANHVELDLIVRGHHNMKPDNLLTDLLKKSDQETRKEELAVLVGEAVDRDKSQQSPEPAHPRKPHPSRQRISPLLRAPPRERKNGIIHWGVWKQRKSPCRLRSKYRPGSMPMRSLLQSGKGSTRSRIQPGDRTG